MYLEEKERVVKRALKGSHSNLTRKCSSFGGIRRGETAFE